MARSRVGAPIRILAVSPVAEAGGAEVLLVDILSGLRQRGVDVTLFAFGEGPLIPLAKSRDLAVTTAGQLSFRKVASVARGAIRLRQAIRDEKPTILHASHPKGQLIGRIAAAGMPVSYTTQLYEGPSRSSVSCRVASRLRSHRFAITDETAVAYATRYSSIRPEVIYPGTDIRGVRARAEAGDGLREWARLEAGDGAGRRVLMAGRLQRFKGPFDFIEAAEQVLRAEPRSVFLIAGPDSPIEPELRGELQVEIARRGLERRVALTGQVSSADLAALMATATLFVHPSVREPFGLVLVEAMSLRTPVIAYAADGPRRILAHGGGALVPVGDVPCLAATIVTALRNQDLWQQWAQEAPGIAETFDISASVVKYLDAMRAISDASSV